MGTAHSNTTQGKNLLSSLGFPRSHLVGFVHIAAGGTDRRAEMSHGFFPLLHLFFFLQGLNNVTMMLKTCFSFVLLRHLARSA